MEGWRSWLDGAPDLHDLGAQAYMLLTMCRVRALAQTGSHVDNLEAAAWAQRELPESVPLIETAVGWRRAVAPGEPIAKDPDQTLPGVLNFARTSIDAVLGQAS